MKIPETKFVGEIKIHNQTIPCAVLFDGEKATRLLVQRQIVGLLTGNIKGGLDRYLQPINLKPYIPEQFKDKSLKDSTLKFRHKGMIAHGFKGADLIDICNMYLRARADGKLLDSQQHLIHYQKFYI